MMHPGMYSLSLPRGALRPAHVVGSGVVLRVAWGRRTCTTSSYCRRGYPLIQGTDSGPLARLRGGCEPVGGARV
jgi:hypothetical protein